eukprot:CAMPEP_0195521526 /NCGR_PEP_ID=MMETSP0794_2-20130614/18890_1 /TAXON_ID=515487 /ORGANISM="Stephanopyxis turris, Strain CCMP 815" /LENGTH=201 /DNA_ID=CAMNT_0040651101 /DNA_START=8 /DNA_END=613 /DNA_ORIENTATION=+
MFQHFNTTFVLISVVITTILLQECVPTHGAACGMCLVPAAGSQKYNHHYQSSANGMFGLFPKSGGAVLSRHPAHIAACYMVSRGLYHAIGSFAQDQISKEEGQNTEEDSPAAGEDVERKSPVSSSMVSAIGFYKSFISPLLPPACRFVPTCSQYGVQAIEEFGPARGAILTAWRLARCTPFGGRGYDPPRWPPVAYNEGSY